MHRPKGPFRAGKLFVLDSKCDTCIFRPGNLMHLRENQVDAMVKSCVEENRIIACHETLDDLRSVCRGLWDVHRSEIMILRLATALKIVAFVPPPERAESV